eukprot:301985-Ditylum_brightwellii.AAC.1
MDCKEVSEDRSARRGRLAFDNQEESKWNQTAPSLIVNIRESFGTHALLEMLPYRTPLHGKRRESYWATLVIGTRFH